MGNSRLISITLPVKNESRLNIEWTLNNISEKVVFPYEILVIYDDDDDCSLPVVQSFIKKCNTVTLHKNTHGNGVLNAIKTGIDKARGDILVIMAADKTDDPQTINSMYKKITEGYDIVCPTRYSMGGKVIGTISVKSILSRISGLCAPLVLGIPTSDLTYSFKMFKKEILKNIDIKSQGGFEFSEEMVIKAWLYGYKIAEVPTIWRDRQYGKSNFKLIQWLPFYIYWYLWGLSQRIIRYITKKGNK